MPAAARPMVQNSSKEERIFSLSNSHPRPKTTITNGNRYFFVGLMGGYAGCKKGTAFLSAGQGTLYSPSESDLYPPVPPEEGCSGAGAVGVDGVRVAAGRGGRGVGVGFGAAASARA